MLGQHNDTFIISSIQPAREWKGGLGMEGFCIFLHPRFSFGRLWHKYRRAFVFYFYQAAAKAPSKGELCERWGGVKGSGIRVSRIVLYCLTCMAKRLLLTRQALLLVCVCVCATYLPTYTFIAVPFKMPWMYALDCFCRNRNSFPVPPFLPSPFSRLK